MVCRCACGSDIIVNLSFVTFFFRLFNLTIFGAYVLRLMHIEDKAYSWGHSVLQTHFLVNTDNPLYTDTRYNDKIRYNDNLTVTKPSL